MKATSIGLGLGLFGAYLIAMALTRAFSQLNLNFFDPIAFSAMTLLVAITAGLASYIPARRASRVDPMIVLREE